MSPSDGDPATGDPPADHGRSGRGDAHYSPGDIVNGWVLGSDMRWHPAAATGYGSPGPGSPSRGYDMPVAELRGLEITVQLSGTLLILNGMTEDGRRMLGDRDTIAVPVVDVIDIAHGPGDPSRPQTAPGWLTIRFRDADVLRSVTVWYHPYLFDTAERVHRQIRDTPRNTSTTGLQVAPPFERSPRVPVDAGLLAEIEAEKRQITAPAWLLWALLGGLNAHLVYLYPKQRATIIALTLIALVFTLGLSMSFWLVNWIFVPSGIENLARYRAMARRVRPDGYLGQR